MVGTLRRPSLGFLVGGAMVLAGFTLGLRPLSDNSFLTHLATGRLILDTGSVPASDPYSFTAAGEPWVVQSWLVSVLMAMAEELAGPTGVRLVVAGLMALLAGLAWSLTAASKSVVVRLVITGLVMVVGAELWAERPLLVGLLGIGTVLLCAEGRIPAWVLIPGGWIWVNSHGSFPLGLVLLVALGVGARLDGEQPQRESRAAGYLTVGVLAGAIGPLGWRALTFPVELLARSDALADVVEWRAPTFDGPSQRAFLVVLVLAIWALARTPSYRRGLPVTLFMVAALISLRNVPVAALVAVPLLAGAAPSVGSLRSADRPRLAVGALGALVALATAVVVGRLQEPDFQFARYPTTALEWQQHSGTDSVTLRHATPDRVGNLLTLLYGDAGVVYYDDRFDMYPDEVTRGSLVLLRGATGWRSALDRVEIDLVTWPRERPLATALLEAADWRPLYEDDRWVVVCRRESAQPGSRC
jgi:hypothetical protein